MHACREKDREKEKEIGEQESRRGTIRNKKPTPFMNSYVPVKIYGRNCEVKERAGNAFILNK